MRKIKSMSVLIKDILMPKNCSECPVALCGKYCRINQTYTTFIKLPIRPDHCPLTDEIRFRCNDKDFVEKALSKMETREDNIYNPGSFIYLMKCSNYKYDKNKP